MQVTEKLTPEAWIHQPCEASLHLMLALRWSRMLQKHRFRCEDQLFPSCKATEAPPPESTPKTSREVRGGEGPRSGASPTAQSWRRRPRPHPLARLPSPHLSCRPHRTAPPTRPGSSRTRGGPHPLSRSSLPPPRHLLPPHHLRSTLWRGLRVSLWASLLKGLEPSTKRPPSLFPAPNPAVGLITCVFVSSVFMTLLNPGEKSAQLINQNAVISKGQGNAHFLKITILVLMTQTWQSALNVISA